MHLLSPWGCFLMKHSICKRAACIYLETLTGWEHRQPFLSRAPHALSTSTGHSGGPQHLSMYSKYPSTHLSFHLPKHYTHPSFDPCVDGSSAPGSKKHRRETENLLLRSLLPWGSCVCVCGGGNTACKFASSKVYVCVCVHVRAHTCMSVSPHL